MDAPTPVTPGGIIEPVADRAGWFTETEPATVTGEDEDFTFYRRADGIEILETSGGGGGYYIAGADVRQIIPGIFRTVEAAMDATDAEAPLS